MNVTLSRFGRVLTPLLLGFSLVGAVFAAPVSTFTLVSGTAKTLTPASLVVAEKTATKGQSSPNGKMLTFGQKVVRLVAVTGPEDDMLSYRIADKRNPPLVVPRGATIKLLFVNSDDDMLHNIRFGAALKTYPNMMISYLKSSVGSSDLPHKSETVLHGEELTLHAPNTPGTYVYLCTVRGHAQGGMVGKVVVR